MKAWRSRLDIVATLIMLVAASAVLWVTLENRSRVKNRDAATQQARLPSEPLSLAGADVLGSPTALVALVVFSDFQCPFCQKFAQETLAELERNYVSTGKVLLAFRNLPLDAVHPFARRAAEGAKCAARQGGFWPMHNQLFQDRARLDEVGLRQRADMLGLNVPAFDVCMGSQTAALIDADVKLARNLGVSGTPTSFVGVRQGDDGIKVTERFAGAKSYDSVRAAVDKLLTSRTE